MPYTPPLAARPEDLTPNNFSPVGTRSSQEENIYDRPIAEQTAVFARHADYIGWAHMLRMMGTVTGKNLPTTGHYEEPWKEDLVTFGSVITPSGGAGTTAVYALTAASMYNTNVTVGGAGRQASYVLPNDVIELADGSKARVESKDTSVTPHRVTLKPGDSTVDLATAVALNTGYHLAYNIFGEGSAGPGIRQPRYIKYSNTFGIIKNAWGQTGSERTNVVYQDVLPGKQGGIYWRLSKDAYRAQEKAMDGFLLFGEQFDNIVDLDTSGLNVDVNVVGTEGYIQFVKTGGTIVTPTAGSYTVADLDAIATVLEDERATSSNAVVGLTGSLIHLERENAMQELFANDLTPFIDNMLGKYGQLWDYNNTAKIDGMFDHTYDFGIQSIRKGGINFSFKKLAIFNDIKRAGAKIAGVPTYEYPNVTMYQPIGERVKTDTAAMAPVIGYEYKESEGVSRHMVVNTISGAGTRNGEVANEYDSSKTILTSEIAAHYCCANNTVYELLS